MGRPTLRNFASRSIPSQGAANFFAEMKFEDDAIAVLPPLVLRPAPKLQVEPRFLPDAEFKKAAENYVQRQNKCGATRPSSSLVHHLPARMRLIVGGELAGDWDSFGGIGPQWPNLAQIALTRLAQNRGTAARVLAAQSLIGRRLARDSHYISKVARQPSEPFRPRTTRAIADRRKEFGARANDADAGKKRGGGPPKRRENGGNRRGRRTDRPPARARSQVEGGYNAYPGCCCRDPPMGREAEDEPLRWARGGSPLQSNDHEDARTEW